MRRLRRRHVSAGTAGGGPLTVQPADGAVNAGRPLGPPPSRRQTVAGRVCEKSADPTGSAGVSPVPGVRGRGPVIPAGPARRRPSGAHPGVPTGTGETPALPGLFADPAVVGNVVAPNGLSAGERCRRDGGAPSRYDGAPSRYGGGGQDGGGRLDGQRTDASAPGELTRCGLLRSGAALSLGFAGAVTTPALMRPRVTKVPTSGKDVTRLAFWGGWTGPDGAVMQRLVGLFNNTNQDVQVTLTLYNWDLIFDRWREEFDGGTPPDIICLHATEVAEFAARGMLRDITAEARRFLPDGANFFPPPWRLCHVDGGLYAVPLDIHPLGLYINAAAARRAGLDPRRPPGDAAALDAWSARLTDAARHEWGYAVPAGDVECFRQWYSLLYQFGGRFMDPTGTRCVVDSAAGVRAFTFLRDMIANRHVAMPREGSADADFIAGTVSMYQQGPWYIQGARRAGIELLTAPLPRIGPRPAVWANSHTLGVVNTPDGTRVEAAMRLIAWLNSRALDWAEAGQIPADNSARARLHTTRIWPYLRPFVAQLPSIVYQPNLLAHTQLFTENTPTPVISETQAVMLGHRTPVEAARAMSEQVDGIVDSR